MRTTWPQGSASRTHALPGAAAYRREVVLELQPIDARPARPCCAAARVLSPGPLPRLPPRPSCISGVPSLEGESGCRGGPHLLTLGNSLARSYDPGGSRGQGRRTLRVTKNADA